ncbi:hypothetical protein H6G54_09075 [Anabaena cylindrica FACHB-243]|uniref:Uncharacterized protein n=1 Tax=Anabaena cylindrica (strain ATCC 27899 / PCC 7122) TaxID=272123 RepID=K9ZNF3_ANACC|nr:MULTISPECIES: hypothetical protein [Anabaena]AFZ60087.1 hypothetical protein Anacy_4742 [Anabaena cylindrica PCC 7122]MBD2417857.1 hypothetical protein [Anabaena cylindrica FACHB-243]MBY5282562.1 hypothetical protein [Anabaena sp. CCAP 1446/1C]MBY5310715.1 hypothetical protein [Anabaena sp. CCAP 1446/1C]MCM2404772.1 hypothetical protein [Anabaena sp. CCAP 1446/1C]
MLKKLLFAGTLVIIIWSGILLNSASSQQVDFRVNNLESDLRRLELRLNQIELSLSQNRQFPSSRTTLTPPKPTNSRRNWSQSERDKMFDKLSILVVEVKQQVNDLGKRVVKLESGK